MPKLASFATAFVDCFKYRTFYGRMNPGHLLGRCNNAAALLKFLRANELNIGPENLDGSQWNAFRAHLREHGALKNNTYSAYTQTLRIFYAFWESEGNPVPRWRVFLKYADYDDAFRPHFSKAEIQELLHRLAKHPSYLAAELGLFVLCSALTGLRTFEVLALSPASRTRVRRWPAFLVKGKGEKERLVPIAPDLDALLLAYGRGRPNRRYFSKISRYCWRLKYYVSNTQSRNLLIALPGQNFGPLIGRRYFATHCVKSGMRVDQLQLLLGHADIDSSMIYVNTDDQELFGEYDTVNFRER
jgi:integrase/recombinase XerC